MAPSVASEAGFSTAQAVTSEENAQLPGDAAAGQLSHEANEPKFDIVCVHGIHGDETTWDVPPYFNCSGSTRLNNIFSDVAPDGGRFIPYNYNPDEEGMGCYTLQGSYKCAHKLLEVIAKSRTPEIRDARRPIYLACHDVGGIIIKTAIILASMGESTYADILYCIRGVIFFGYPHRSHTTADLEEQLFWLLSLNNDRYRGGRKMTIVKSLAETIGKVNDAFVHTKMLVQARVVNIFSTDDDPTKRIFDKFTATLGVAFEYRLPSDKPHLELADAGKIDSYTSALSPNKDWLQFNEAHNTSLRKWLNQASPIYPSIHDNAIEHSELATLFNSRDNQILHIQCISNAEGITESVNNYFGKQESSKREIYYFRFRSHDVRFNSIPAMLWTFFAQSAYIYPTSLNVGANFPRIYDGHPCEYQSLLHMWQAIALQVEIAHHVLVLGCLDECDDSSLRFISQIHNIFMALERRLKVIIITTKGTTKDELIVNALSKFPPNSIARILDNQPSSIPPDARFDVSMLLQESRRFAVNDLRDKIETLISGCSHDEALRRLLVNWLKSSQNPSQIITRILKDSQTPPPELIFENILADMPEKYHPWAQKILSWVLSSVRPLKTSELCRVSDLCLGDDVDAHIDEPTVHGNITNIIHLFRGLLVTVYDEVHFSHASIRGWLKSLDPRDDAIPTTKEWYRTMERDRQMTIVQTCLKHLRVDTDQIQAWAAQLPYATQFWVWHYNQVGPIEGVFETIFQHQSRLECWIDAYMALPSPFFKPSREFRKPLPIASHFGLEDIIRSILANNDYDNASLNQALIEAAGASQLPAFRLLIERYPSGLDLKYQYVLTALLAATRSENHELCRELVNHVNHLRLPEPEMSQQQPEEQHSQAFANDLVPLEPNSLSSELTNALDVACELDMTDVVAKLISSGLDKEIILLKNNLSGYDTPFDVAAKYSQLDSAKLLLAAGASLDPSDLATTVWNAARYGSVDMARLLLDHGAPFDGKNSAGLTPLHVACLWGNFAVAKLLLQQRDFREYATSIVSFQPLMFAVLRGHYMTTEALLQHGADPNIHDEDCRTPLWTATIKDRTDICRLLLAHKADPNLLSHIERKESQQRDERTPLIDAVNQENMELVRLLVENGADVNQYIDNKSTPLYSAAAWNVIEAARYLLSRNADPNLAMSNGATPIWLAAKLGYSEIVRLLAEAKADVHIADNTNEWTPIHAVSDSAETVRILLEHGADINKTSKDWDTPFSLAIVNDQYNATKEMLSQPNHKPDWSLPAVKKAIQLAVGAGYTKVISLLLEAGVDVNLVDDTNRCLATFAMPLGDDSMIRAILEFGPNLDMKDNGGDTVLHFIGKDTPVESVRRVVNAGGKLDSMNREFETPLMSSIMACNTDVFTYLMTKKLVVDSLNIASFNKEGAPLHFACAQGTMEMVKVLIEKGADVNYACTSVYGTPLIAATRRRRENRDTPVEDVVELLLEKGADPTKSAGDSGSPLISASIGCSTKTIQLLLNHKASVDVKDLFGRKPVHFACYNTLEVLNTLGVPDSDFAVRDVVGRVPLHYAVLRGQLDLVEEVFARSQRVGVGIDVLDDDGWTPLLWAARVCRIFLWEESPPRAQYDAVVEFLLSKGANPSISGRGLYEDWTVPEVAYYHHADSIADAVIERGLTRKKTSRSKKRGKLHAHSSCDCCLLAVSGVYFQRVDTKYIYLCFKCYRSKSRIAPQHEFEEYGYEWDSEDEAPDTVQPKPIEPSNGETLVNGGEAEIQFDDEIVEEEDMEI
ncbi:ankyrin repeat-containing domain protein [Trichoderma chlorosporum]